MSENTQRGTRWGRWIGLTVLTLIAGVFLFHAIWSSVTESHLRRRIAELQKAGEPVLPADFEVIDPGSADNAVPDIVEAVKLIDQEDPAWQAYDKMYAMALPLTPEERQAIAGIVKQSTKSLDLIEQGRMKSQMVRDVRLRSPVFETLLPNLGNQRPLAQLLGAAALLDHEDGDDRMAIRRLDRVIFIARYPDTLPFLIGHLVSVGCVALAADRAAIIAPDLRIGTAPGDVPPDELRRFIDLLLDDKPSTDGLILSLRGERMAQVDIVQSWAKGVSPGPGIAMPAASSSPGRYITRPLIYRAGNIMVDYMNAMIPAAREPDWPAASAKMPHYVRGKSSLDVFADMLLPSLDRAVMTHFRGMTERRLSAAALAIRWYAVEHNGQLPQRLADLVPRYLPAVPGDPFAAGGRPLGYKPDPNAPVVYSVGSDGVDDGGSEAGPNPKHKPVGEWEMKDRVLHLTRQPRPVAEEDADAPTTLPSSDVLPATNPATQ